MSRPRKTIHVSLAPKLFLVAMKRPLSRPTEFNKILDRLFFCPSCSTWRISQSRRPTSFTRKASTLTSRTAVNATKTIPARFRPLYTALEELRRAAPAHVSLSRLELAQQGLESESPKIRVAILGVDVPDTARKVARLLLADALEGEQDWEKKLVTSPKYENGVLLRYGQAPNTSLAPVRSPISTLQIPATILERANLEILVSSVSSSRSGQLNAQQRIPAEAFLAPTVRTPTASDGRQTVISQPMHASLVIVDGFDAFVKLAELLASTNFSSDEEKGLVKVVLEQQGYQLHTKASVAVIDTDKATEGLIAIRRSIGEATTFEHKWVESGVPQISTWLVGIADTSGPIPSSVKSLISSLTTATASSLENHHTSIQTTSTSARLSPAILANLDSAIDEFSRNAHAELQSGLNSAWTSRNWRKLAWYKLFWRVDDVGLIITDLITNAWLPRTERAVYELSGRLSQTGISPVELAAPKPHDATPATAPSRNTAIEPLPLPVPLLQAQSTLHPTPQEPVITNKTGQPQITLSPMPRPTPLSTTISTTRALTISTAINTLHNTSQHLVLRTLSISVLSASLSLLSSISFNASPYSAGTIFAFGTVLGLYRMQGSWLKATRELEEGLFEEGRGVIRRVVAGLRGCVAQKERLALESEGRGGGGRDAREAVERVRGELDRLDRMNEADRVVDGK